MNNEREYLDSPEIIAWIYIIWIILSCLFGWILSLFADPPGFIWLLYLNYENIIYYYDLFCLAMLSSIALMPLALFFSWKSLWDTFDIPPHSSKSRIFVFIMLTPIMLLPGLGFGGMEKNVALKLIAYIFDWIGGVVFNIFCFFVFFWSIAFTVKLIKRSKNGRKNYY